MRFFKKRKMKEVLKEVFRNYLLFTSMLTLTFIAMSWVYVSYDIVQDIINGLIDAVKNIFEPMARGSWETFLGQLVEVFVWTIIWNYWDLEFLAFALLFGFTMGGNGGDQLLQSLGTVIFFARLVTFRLPFIDYMLIGTAVGIELIPFGFDISLLPVIIPLLIAKQNLLASIGYMIGAFISRLVGLGEARGIRALIIKLTSFLVMITLLIHLLTGMSV